MQTIFLKINISDAKSTLKEMDDLCSCYIGPQYKLASANYLVMVLDLKFLPSFQEIVGGGVLHLLNYHKVYDSEIAIKANIR